MQVLALDSTGSPRNWLTAEEAITNHVLGRVIWELGEQVIRFRGGHNNDGVQSEITSAPIIALRGKPVNMEKAGRIALNNRSLFLRDQHICAYCVRQFSFGELSRDHIVPRSRGGHDDWTNVVTACKKCNQKKSDRLLREVGMELAYVPYVPNHFERLILENRGIRGDQMDFLRNFLPKHSRVMRFLETD